MFSYAAGFAKRLSVQDHQGVRADHERTWVLLSDTIRFLVGEMFRKATRRFRSIKTLTVRAFDNTERDACFLKKISSSRRGRCKDYPIHTLHLTPTLLPWRYNRISYQESGESIGFRTRRQPVER